MGANMSLRFYFGPSGAGKSRAIYQEVIRRSMECPRQTFLVLVPDQFTMQTQKDLAALHARGGILNIDVLSFGRLAYRVLEEVGGGEVPVLDDTGKSLVLQKVAASLKERLPVLGSHLHKQGYLHEVKSALSEFMQYGIGPDDVSKLIEFSRKRGALRQKLEDLETLYKGFTEYIQGHFVTTEETLEVLRRSLHKSRLVRGSVAVFDGFTGFTPIQSRVIQEIMSLAQETVVTLTVGREEDPYRLEGEQKLFYLSQKTRSDLERLAAEAGAGRGEDVFVEQPFCRFVRNPALAALERQIFRYQVKAFAQKQDSVRLFEATSPQEEVHQAGLLLLEQIRERGISYRDIAVITGDLEAYAPYVETEFAQLGLPYFLDRTKGIVLNPMTESMKSALGLYRKDFSYEAVFHYLRSGLADLTPEETDELETYVIQTGIRGLRRWSRPFTHKTRQTGEDEEALRRLNELRERFLKSVESLDPKGARDGEAAAGHPKAKAYVENLYRFLVENQVQRKLLRYEELFTQKGQFARAKEYAQIYRLVVDLLNQIYQLLGEERIRLQEFEEILEAGLREIEVGTIPQNVDRIVVGDMERTRLRPVKVLFVLGVNDGNIPKNAAKGGIISDMDREFLKDSQIELAPSPRQQMYIQRLYLYLNLTKPSDLLFLSYSRVNSAGKAIRPAYLVDVVKKLFPLLKTEFPQNRPVLEQVATPGEGLRYLAEGLRKYADGELDGLGKAARERWTEEIPAEEASLSPAGEFFTLYRAYGELTVSAPDSVPGGAGEDVCRERRELLTRAAFSRYEERRLPKAVARALYGLRLESSVSRLETYAACAYRHFLEYGLSLREREEYGFEAVDMGNVFHEVLARFAGKLEESPYTWFDFPPWFGEESVKEALESYAAEYSATVLYGNARNEYAIVRMGRILARTVDVLQKQLQQGEFQPDGYELSFHDIQDLENVQESLELKGRIDRVDIAETPDKVYVKVIDYKSGNRQFDLAALYFGLQLQLVVYMNAALEIEGGKQPGKQPVPAALLYYHIDDPTVETPIELPEEEIWKEILRKLRMNGVVNGEEEIVSRLDRSMGAKSAVIPVERKKDGSFSSRSCVMSGEELKTVSEYVNHKIRSLGKEILDGRIALDPYRKGGASADGDACTYCPYQKACGFDPAIPGFTKRELPSMGKAQILESMKQPGAS
ncbi:MAG: exodeoxyribonuclease V subunit gamma [Clostridium sp.]|nr:exodeoxyribonuclease V subunit gamma [Clostridium sp.]